MALPPRKYHVYPFGLFAQWQKAMQPIILTIKGLWLMEGPQVDLGWGDVSSSSDPMGMAPALCGVPLLGAHVTRFQNTIKEHPCQTGLMEL